MVPEGLHELALGEDRLRDVLELDTWAFPNPDPIESMLELPNALPWERTWAMSPDGHQLAALHASYPFGSTPVPGGRLDISGLTWVGVHPQWRRRGLLRSMISSHFAHSLARKEPISLLFAAEPAIYGRFGYGLAARSTTLTVPRGAELRPVPTEDLTFRIETVSYDAHAQLVADLHGSVDRPGWVTRSTEQQQRRWLCNSPSFHAGRETQRILIAERDATPVGYAIFRRKPSWNDGGNPDYEVGVLELVTPEASVAHLIWSKLLDLDLTTKVQTGMLALDDPLLSLLVDVRAANPTWSDQLWLRLLDLPTALAGRQYQAGLDVVLEVSDAELPDNAGRWQLRAEPFAQASVQRTDRPADLRLDIRELGAVYLGGTSLTELASAGLVADLTGTKLASTSVAFGWPTAPVASWVF
ncbi:putative acetyltransferase [Propionicimonas paludicola]|uniref:Putative acetyltransferase n=2 Tax=Propionicimonas paludicola TaxID=185243 RepID=A0A2A9CQY0_9ACTN|nr:putative acetyltransferase [Propionicimonas paludicola]